MACPTGTTVLHSGCRKPEGLVQAKIRGPGVLDSPDEGDHEIQNIDVHCRDDVIRCAGNPCSASRAGKSGQPQAPSLQAHRLGTFGGSQSYVNEPVTSFAAILNKRGMVTGWADFDCSPSRSKSSKAGSSLTTRSVAESDRNDYIFYSA
jgi:hypothetical protein